MLRPNGRIKPNTSQEEVENKALYNKLKSEYLSKQPKCERCQVRNATQIHHKARQKGHNRFRFFMAVCAECHTYIHDHSIESIELGYIFDYDPKKEEIE